MDPEKLDQITLEQNDQDDFDSAFDEFAGNTPAQTGPVTNDEPETAEPHRDERGRFATKGESETDNSDEQAPAEDQQPQSQPQLSELEQAQQLAQQWEHRYRSNEGRHNALQRQVQDLQRQLAQAQQSGVKEPGQSKETKPPAELFSGADWESFQEDMPELSAAIASHFSDQQQQIAALSSRFDNELAPIQNQAEQQFYDAQLQQLETKHPDFSTTVNSPEFNQWLNQQPPFLQQLMDSEDASEATYLLDSYKAATAKPEPDPALARRRQQQLDAAKTLPTRAARSPAPADDDFDAAFDEFAANM